MTAVNMKRFSIWLAIVEICKQVYPANMNDCQLFLRAVGSRLGVSFGAGNADAIVEEIRSSILWTTTKDYTVAIDKSNSGHFVVAGIKSNEQKDYSGNLRGIDSGHVAVVIPGGPGRNGFPNVYAGSTGGASVAAGSIRDTFFASDLDQKRVTYSYYRFW